MAIISLFNSAGHMAELTQRVRRHNGYTKRAESFLPCCCLCMNCTKPLWIAEI